MKTIQPRLLGAMILPSALLLSQCGPAGKSLPQTVISIPASTWQGVQAPPQTSTFYPLGITDHEAWFTHSKDEPLSSTLESPDMSNASEANPVTLAPLLVTDDLNSVLTAGMRYWPSNVLDAEQTRAWISFNQPERLSPYPMGGGSHYNFTSYQTQSECRDQGRGRH